MSLDWITDLSPNHYHDAILVVVDRLTKPALFIPITKFMAAPDVAALSLHHDVPFSRLNGGILLAPLPIVTSAPLVSVPNPQLCACSLEYNCAYSILVF